MATADASILEIVEYKRFDSWTRELYDLGPNKKCELLAARRLFSVCATCSRYKASSAEVLRTESAPPAWHIQVQVNQHGVDSGVDIFLILSFP